MVKNLTLKHTDSSCVPLEVMIVSLQKANSTITEGVRCCNFCSPFFYKMYKFYMVIIPFTVACCSYMSHNTFQIKLLSTCSHSKKARVGSWHEYPSKIIIGNSTIICKLLCLILFNAFFLE